MHRARGHRLHSGRVAVELGERREAVDGEHAGLHRLRARHLTAARRQIAGHVAHRVGRAVDLDA
ncbi:MAG: hypothetical protein ABI316_10555, partial [Casimicrobiaceae bacterium]